MPGSRRWVGYMYGYEIDSELGYRQCNPAAPVEKVTALCVRAYRLAFGLSKAKNGKRLVNMYTHRYI